MFNANMIQKYARALRTMLKEADTDATGGIRLPLRRFIGSAAHSQDVEIPQGQLRQAPRYLPELFEANGLGSRSWHHNWESHPHNNRRVYFAPNADPHDMRWHSSRWDDAHSPYSVGMVNHGSSLLDRTLGPEAPPPTIVPNRHPTAPLTLPPARSPQQSAPQPTPTPGFTLPNWGRASLVGASALGAAGLANMFNPEEVDEADGKRKQKHPWLAPAVGLGAAGLGAGVITDWDYSKLLNPSWWTT